MSYKSFRRTLLLSMALCLVAPASMSCAWAESAPSNPNADSQLPAASNNAEPAAAAKTPKARRDNRDHKKYEHEGGYYSGINYDKDRFSDNQKRHNDEGYYTDIKPYVAPPPEPKPVAPPPPQPEATVPPPLVVPAVHTPGTGDRKFNDDTGNTGSISATRHAKQAQELLSTGHYGFARRHFKESLDEVPNQPDLYPGYWEACAKSNDWSEAQHALEKYFELAPNKKPEYMWAYGQTFYELRRYEKAVETLEEAAKYGNHLDQIHRMLIQIALVQRNIPEAIMQYNAFLKVKPSDYKTQLEFANFLEVQGKHADAINHYKSAASLAPNDGPLAARLAYLLMYYNKDYKSAITYYTRAMSADPANAAKYQENINYAESQLTLGSKKKVQQ